MKNLKLRYIATILLLFFTSAVVQALQYRPRHEDDSGLATLRSVPIKIGEWQGEEYPLEETVYDILETRAIIHRSFTTNSGKNVFLSLVHYHDTKVDFHAPEACLGGNGLQTEKTTKTVTLHSNGKSVTFDLARMITSNPQGKSLVYYFYKTGRFVGSSYLMMRLNIATNKMMRNETKGSLIRISTNFIPGKEKEAEQVLLDFTQDLFPYIDKWF